MISRPSSSNQSWGTSGQFSREEGYLREVRKITREHDVLLIFDEVITGYRIGIGGAQVSYGSQTRYHHSWKGDWRRTSDRGVRWEERDNGD